MAKPLPPIDELFERFEPDSTSPSGLKYAASAGNRKKGDVAGSKRADGYYSVQVNGFTFFTHRIVHAMRTGGDDPSMTVDHKDRNPQNNHPFNLRWATMSEQCYNRRNFGRYLKGVSHKKACKSKPYQAAIFVNSKMKNLGHYATEEEAHQAYINAALSFQPSWPSSCWPRTAYLSC